MKTLNSDVIKPNKPSFNYMTTHRNKPKQGVYDPHYDPRPKLITIGVSLISLEVEDFVIDGRHVQVPVDDAICYLSVDRTLVHTSKGGSNWNEIARLVEETQGYARKHFKIVSVWEPVPQHIAEEIF